MLVLVVSLWRFWPSIPAGHHAAIPVDLAPELAGLFDSAHTESSQPSHFVLGLQVKNRYLQTVKDGTRKAQLGYQLLGDQGILYQGVTDCSFDPRSSTTKVTLPNPQRVSARAIQLHLAR